MPPPPHPPPHPSFLSSLLPPFSACLGFLTLLCPLPKVPRWVLSHCMRRPASLHWLRTLSLFLSFCSCLLLLLLLFLSLHPGSVIVAAICRFFFVVSFVLAPLDADFTSLPLIAWCYIDPFFFFPSVCHLHASTDPQTSWLFRKIRRPDRVQDYYGSAEEGIGKRRRQLSERGDIRRLRC